MKKIKVYVAGPITLGDQFVNVRKAIDAGERLLQAGYIPFIPHLDCLWHMHYPHTGRAWLDWDIEWLKVCDCLLRLPGASVGSDEEVSVAEANGIPVFYDINVLMAAYHGVEHFSEVPSKGGT